MSEKMLNTIVASDLVPVRSNGENYFSRADAIHGSTPMPIAGRSINAQTGTAYTLALSDLGKLVTISNASAITLTVPTTASVAFPIGSVIELAQLGAGLVTIAAASGATVDQVAGTLKLLGQYSVATLRKTGTNTWLLNGDVAAS